MGKQSPAKAGKEAAGRDVDEQREVLADAKPATDKQVEQVDEAGTTTEAPDHTAGTDVGYAEQGVGPASLEQRVPPEFEEIQSAGGNAELLDANIVRHADQRKGVVSASAFNVHKALQLTPKTEWTESLQKAIKAFQKELGQRETGYLTRDQCRRLGLVYQP